MSCCIICMDNTETCIKCIQCSALFHTACINEMMRINPFLNTCPQCRIQLPPRDVSIDRLLFWAYVINVIGLTTK